MARPIIFDFLASFFQWIKSSKDHKSKKSLFKYLKSDFWTAVNVHYAIKTAIAVVGSYFVVLSLIGSFAMWAPITAIIVMQVNVASSVEASIDRIVGSIYGAFIAVALDFVLSHTPLNEMIGLFIIALLCASLLLLNPRYRLAGITSISIFLLAPAHPPTWKFAITFLFIVIVAILVSVAVSVLLWPISGAAELRQSLQKQYLMVADLLETITASFVNGQHHLLPTYLDELHDVVSKNRPAFRRVREFEAINLTRLYPELGLLIEGLEQTRTYLTAMLDALTSDAEPIAQLPMKDELLALSSSSASGLRWLASQNNSAEIPEVRWYIETTSILLADLIEKRDLLNLSQPQFIQVLAFCNAMNHLAESVANLEEQSYIITHKNAAYIRRANKRANSIRRIKQFIKVKFKHYAKNQK